MWLLERLAPHEGLPLLDIGAGVGGPSAFAAHAEGVRPLLTEPAAGACRAARRMFDHPVVQCSATDLPLHDAAFDVAWMLGVLCTIPRDLQQAALAEAARVLTPGGRLGLLVFVADRDPLPFQPEGNAFPTRDRLGDLLRDAGLTVRAETVADDLSWSSPAFDERATAVEEELGRRHGDDERWRTAEHQSGLIGELIAAEGVVPTYLVAERGRPGGAQSSV